MASTDHPLASELGLKAEDLRQQSFIVREQGSGTRSAMEAVRYDAKGNPIARKIWKGVNLIYNITFLLLFLSVILVPIYNYAQELERPENMQRSPLFFIVPMAVGVVFLAYGYYYWFILKTDQD